MISDNWKPAHSYRIHIQISKDEEGGFSVLALNLPGAGSCGDTEEEAVESAKQAILGVLESYKASRDNIPWKDTAAEIIPTGATHKWIILDA